MFEVIFSKDAQKFVTKQDSITKKRLRDAILQLCEDPFSNRNVKKPQGTPDLLRLRVGDFRVVFSVEEVRMVILVIDIDNRGDVYKRI